jgi:hypothetical protein
MGMLDQQQADLDNWRTEELENLEEFWGKNAEIEEMGRQRLAEIQKQYTEQSSRIEQARQKLVLSDAELMFGEMASLASQFTSEQSDEYKALFALSKSFALADATVNMYHAMSKAGASGVTWYDSLIQIGLAATTMAGIISQIAAVGMAHEGIDSVPETGTWLLKKGERVATEKTSARLDRVLNDIQQQRGQGMQVNIHEAPGTTAQVTKRPDGGMDVQIALLEERMQKRMARGAGIAGFMDARYGRRY